MSVDLEQSRTQTGRARAATPATPPRGGMFAALVERNYRIYLTGSFVSNIGTWMQRVVRRSQ
jgi:hypothetical protein